MTPAARLSAAGDILDTLDYSRLVDPQLKSWARRNRFAGSGDRRAIADRVYTCLRTKRTSAALGGDTSGRALVLGSLVAVDELSVEAVASLCTGGYGLGTLTDHERSSLQSSLGSLSEAERFDWPDWLLPEARAVFGDEVGVELQALRHRAPLDLRVNTLRGTVSEARKSLENEGLESETTTICETALRLPPSTSILNTAAFRDGLVEPQDAASQAIATFVVAKPGDTVLDYCAGAGGKTVAIAAIMRNEGKLFAHDIDPQRMSELSQRAEKCDVTIIECKGQQDIAPNSCDAVLIDAPCSGSGSWRRDPIGKWRLDPKRLNELHKAQREALTSAARFVRLGGTLTYATCSILPSENKDQVDWFLSQSLEFSLVDTLNLWPARDGCDGFYAARFQRRDK